MKKLIKQKKIVFGWAVWFYIIILVSSVMAYGLIATLTYHADRTNSISMLGMIPLMGIIIGYTIYRITNTLRMRMDKILIGINEVAKGNLEVEIDLEESGEYKVIYDNFNKMVKEFKSTRTEMQNFINDFSHEFKTPITSIQGFAELLLEENIEEKDQKLYLQIIAEESARLAELSQNTLLLSKLDAQQIVTDKKVFSLDEQLKKCAIVFFRELEKKQIDLDMDLSNVTYYGNPELLYQVWINLISNAIKFTPERGEITISMKELEQEIQINISDSGIGMDNETIGNIFKKYYQGDLSHATRGYGLGLSIVERIITLCVGSISVTSKPECGSTFTVKLSKQY